MIPTVFHVWRIFCNSIVVPDVWNSISETLLLASDIIYLGIPYFTLFWYRYPADKSFIAHGCMWITLRDYKGWDGVGLFLPEHWVQSQMLQICKHREKLTPPSQNCQGLVLFHQNKKSSFKLPSSFALANVAGWECEEVTLYEAARSETKVVGSWITEERLLPVTHSGLG